MKSLEEKGSKDPKTIKLRKKLGEEFMELGSCRPRCSSS